MRLLRIGSSTGFREEIQDIASLHAQGGDGGQDARNKGRASFTLGAKTAFAPKHGAAQGTLRQIIGRFDVVHGNKSPQCVLHFEEVVASLPGLRMVEFSAFQQELVDFGAEAQLSQQNRCASGCHLARVATSGRVPWPE